MISGISAIGILGGYTFYMYGVYPYVDETNCNLWRWLHDGSVDGYILMAVFANHSCISRVELPTFGKSDRN